MKDSNQPKKSLINKLTFITLLTLVFVGCSTVETTSLNEERAIETSPTQTDSNQNNQAGIIESGWQIPLPEKKRTLKKSIVTRVSEDGKNIKVTTTECAPINDFIYEEKLTDYQKTKLISGELQLKTFIENKVNEKIFWYTIFAKQTESNEQKSDNSSHNHIFVYRIVDKDGDGKFETRVSDSSEILVPKWAIE